jgi:hypothetical protein
MPITSCDIVLNSGLYKQAHHVHVVVVSLSFTQLRLAYEDSKSEIFFPYPDFRDFAMAFIIVEDNYFGKGIAQNPIFSYVAMGGPAFFNRRTRQLYMIYEGKSRGGPTP